MVSLPKKNNVTIERKIEKRQDYFNPSAPVSSLLSFGRLFELIVRLTKERTKHNF